MSTFRQDRPAARIGRHALVVSEDGLRRSAVAPLLEVLARSPRMRRRSLALSLRLESGMFWSATAREHLRRYHGVDIGAYSYGECFVPGALPPGTVVGRYVSVAAGVRAFTRNHPMERLSLHPFFYNQRLGIVASDTIASGRLIIDHEAWIGERAIITPGCARIGIGAVVGAGAVVTRDVDDFAVVAGNPAKRIKMRFDEDTARLLLRSRWWDRPLRELREWVPDLLKPVVEWSADHPLLRAHA
jgi:acetyltransferase-like isoleucine patch superfamily enzyme